MQTEQFIRERDIVGTPKKPGLLPISRACLWAWVKNKKFPQPFKLGSTITCWKLSEIQSWMEDRSKADQNQPETPKRTIKKGQSKLAVKG